MLPTHIVESNMPFSKYGVKNPVDENGYKVYKVFGKPKEDWPPNYTYDPSPFQTHAGKDVELEFWRSILLFDKAPLYNDEKMPEDLVHVCTCAENVPSVIEASRVALAKKLSAEHLKDIQDAQLRRKGQAPRAKTPARPRAQLAA